MTVKIQPKCPCVVEVLAWLILRVIPHTAITMQIAARIFPAANEATQGTLLSSKYTHIIFLIVAVVKMKIQPNDCTWGILHAAVTVRVNPVDDLVIIQYYNNTGKIRTEVG
jgi:hypothetical protein